MGRNYRGAFPEKSFEHRDLIVDALTCNRHGGYWDERDVGNGLLLFAAPLADLEPISAELNGSTGDGSIVRNAAER